MLQYGNVLTDDDDGFRDYVANLEIRIKYMEELFDTYLHSPVWKRIWFWAMGWPCDRIASQPGPSIWTRAWRKLNG